MAALLLLLSSLGAMALRDHVGWLADAEKAHDLAGGADLLAALASLSAGAALMTKPDVAAGRRLLEQGEQQLGGDLAMALALAPEVVALAAHGWLWIEERSARDMLDRLVAAGREAASVGALPYPLAARAHGHLSSAATPGAAGAEEAVESPTRPGRTRRSWSRSGCSPRCARGEAGEAAIPPPSARSRPGSAAGLLPAIYAKFALGLLAAAGEHPEVAIERLEACATTRCPATSIGRRAGRRLHARGPPRRRAGGRRALRRAGAPPHRAAMLERMRGMTARGRGALPRRARAARRRPGTVRLARTQLAYGEWLRAEGRREEARDPLREALAASSRSRRGRSPSAPAASCVPRAPSPAQCAGRKRSSRRTSCAWPSLAQGLTNREAAAALFVSAKTIEHHLRNVFRKLGVRRRTELARMMAAR